MVKNDGWVGKERQSGAVQASAAWGGGARAPGPHATVPADSTVALKGLKPNAAAAVAPL